MKAPSRRGRSDDDPSSAPSLLIATLEATADGILVVDHAGKIVRFNERFAKLWRLPQTILETEDDDQAISYVLSQLKDPDSFVSKVRELYAHPDAESFDVLEFHDGRVFERYSIPQRSGGNAVGRVWSFRDVTLRVVEERERAAAEARARHRLERLDSLWRLLTDADLDGRRLSETILTEGRRALELDFATLSLIDGARVSSQASSPSQAHRPGKALLSLEGSLASIVIEAGRTVHTSDLRSDPAFKDDPRVAQTKLRSAIATPIAVGERTYVLGFGSRRPRVAPFDGEDREYVELLAAYFGRLLRLREQESQISYLAYHDALTGLENRRRCLERLDEAIVRAKRSKRRFALMFIDLDRFKEVNDTFGHISGDRVLAETGARLRQVVRGGDAAARFGGDEFAVLMTETRGPSDTDELAQRLGAALAEPFAIEGREVALAACLGIAVYPDDGLTASDVIASADAALYRAKELGRGRICFFSQDIAAKVQNRRHLQQGLRQAVQRGEFALVYQPVVSLVDGRVVAVEALIRWHHPERGIIFPGEFIPAAEDTALMVPIGDWVIKAATAQLARWWRAGRLWRVAINISAVQLQDALFTSQLSAALDRTGVPAELLELELTESAALKDPEAAQATVAECRRIGMRVALDDFGTHYASLAHLKTLPVDIIKIDRSFVRGLPEDANDGAIVRSVLALGTNFGCEIVAEGVETQEQADWLRDNGCAIGQGFLLARPMTAQALDEWAASRQARA